MLFVVSKEDIKKCLEEYYKKRYGIWYRRMYK